MRLLKILLILLGSILLVFGNVYALNLNDQADRYSLSSRSLSFEKKELNAYINPAINSMIKSSPSLIKFNDSYGPNELIDNFNRDRINIPGQNIQTGNGCNVTDKVRECLIFRLTSLPIKNRIYSKTNLICNPELLFDFYLHRKFKIRSLFVKE